MHTVIISCCHQFFESVPPPTLTFHFKSRFNSNWAKSISPNKQCSSIPLQQPKLWIKSIIFATFIPLINKCTTVESSKETLSSYTKCECFVNRSVYSSVQPIFFSFLFLVVQHKHDNPIERYVWTADKKERKIGSKLQGTRYEYGDNWSSSGITFSNSLYGMITITLLDKTL